MYGLYRNSSVLLTIRKLNLSDHSLYIAETDATLGPTQLMQSSMMKISGRFFSFSIASQICRTLWATQ